MSYKSIIKQVAKEYGTTPQEVDAEIRKAIKLTGLEITPDTFIALNAAKAKMELHELEKNGKA